MAAGKAKECGFPHPGFAQGGGKEGVAPTKANKKQNNNNNNNNKNNNPRK